MPTKNRSKIDYAQRWREIRRYVDFKIGDIRKLTSYEKRKINAYHNVIQELTARPFIIYRPRRKDRLKKAQEYARHETTLKGIKVAFVPVSDPAIPHKLSFDKAGDLIVDTPHVSTKFLAFDQKKLAADTVKHVNDVAKKEPKAKKFNISAGKYEIPAAHAREFVGEEVAKLIAKYSNEESNHFYANWLHGMTAHSFKRQASFDEYQREKEAAKIETKRVRKAAKKKAQRAAATKRANRAIKKKPTKK